MGPQKWVEIGGFRESPPSLVSKKERLALCSTTASVLSSAGRALKMLEGVAVAACAQLLRRVSMQTDSGRQLPLKQSPA